MIDWTTPEHNRRASANKRTKTAHVFVLKTHGLSLSRIAEQMSLRITAISVIVYRRIESIRRMKR